VITRAFKPETLRQVAADPTARRLSVWAEAPTSCPYLRLHLRDEPGFEDREQRWGGVVMPATTDVTPLLDLVRAIGQLAPIVSAGLARYESAARAEAECWGGGDSQELDAVTDARLYEDAMSWRRSRTKLRRLYPMTIIGPAIWRDLPPMPAFTPAPTVENLGDCKLLTAWPTLCDPRDPAFLRANRDLRAWLWPHTIENPADHVDNDPVG